MERHALTALQWFWTPVAPHQPVATVAEGLDFCVSCLRVRGLSLLGAEKSARAQVLSGLESRQLAGMSAESGASRVEAASQAVAAPVGLGLAGVETLSDGEGVVRVGLVARDVLWAQLAGRLTAELGVSYSERLEALLSGHSGLRCFFDSSRVESYDLVARNAVGRVLLQHEARIAFALTLNWSGDISTVGRAIAGSLGGRMRWAADRAEFEHELRCAAPAARLFLERLELDPHGLDKGARPRQG